ncbi:MAG: DUF4276 family protein [Planctomycetes bacterium]|jgi:hypothetical protein|nr:DUF4276 family protein [Phycisphaerae bacterium]NBB94528.1 DUF4276 family protein [Planctomycetota bacterium]
MAVSHVEVLVEEPSMEAALRVLLPRVLGDLSFDVYPHQGKADLLKRLPDRLHGYAKWLPDDYRIVVVVDRDEDVCHDLKQQLEQIASNAGLRSRSQAGGQSYQVVNRLAIEELEAWYFGDWDAVRSAYPKVPATISSQAKYRDPDAITGGTWEAFERVLKRAGYFQTGLRKIEAARAVAEHWQPQTNRSKSFCVFRDVLMEMTT